MTINFCRFLQQGAIILGLCGSLTAQAASESEAGGSRERFGPPVRSQPDAVLGIGDIDLHNGGNVCYHTANSVRLWREDSGRAERVELKNTSTNQQVQLLWRIGQNNLAWPLERLPITDGTSYLLTTKNASAVVVLYQIPDNLRNITQQQVWMQQQGCVVLPPTTHAYQ